MEYFGKFSQSNCEEYDCYFDVETFLSNLNLINLPEMATSQVECLAFISGYAVFSYIKKSNGSILCRNFLTTNTSIQLNNDMDTEFLLIEFVDRDSPKYPSTSVIESAKVIFDIFSKIYCNKNLFENFYSGFPRTKLIQLAYNNRNRT